ncbi:MAG TPA: RNA polymerase factor sigma-54 [Saprospiraceae bacterium]|nr:RNA polymerase factor sigma-54 [Saprospiraceae bacterium]MCC6689699.1 RNA polymerase factor sigma-54 [Saprospiraceae bacterium]HMV23687.1 RNA polymerase factor sigma-54 [Saprospiraceae bacterium]HMX84143.1 RNA polymerase factor sigma-54 [Saprospiraceae bacterium]HMX86330.1 RNA polymerase factor sigma-54 [Saprospiraceae bacterium]
MLKQSLSQKMLQKLSPQQIQLMKLLQIPTATLEQRIKEELEANPALDEGDEEDDFYGENSHNQDESTSKEENDDFTDTDDNEDNYSSEEYSLEEYLSEYMNDDDAGSYKLKGEGYHEEEEKQVPFAVENSFHEYLEAQLGLINLTDERETSIAKQIIGSIDDDGYLRREPIAIIDDLMFSQNIITTEEEVMQVLKKVQTFDPPGVGARDLRECLLLQLKHKVAILPSDTTALDKKVLEIAIRIIDQYFEEFSKKHYPKLQRTLGVSELELKYAIDEILKSNPKPASGYEESNSHSINYIIPDYIIVNREGNLELTLNSRNAPDLRINEHYVDMLKEYNINRQNQRATRKDKEAILFIKQKIDSAKWFIDAIRQRQHTMYTTMYAIMQFQAEYFLTGDDTRLKPMILKDISDITGLDISTISRVANSKFVQTEFGTKRLKEFFSESLQTEDGSEVSTLEVKKILTDVIGGENKRKPLSDEKLKNILRNKGYNIARRTVAKYREQLNIPVARLRKEL